MEVEFQVIPVVLQIAFPQHGVAGGTHRQQDFRVPAVEKFEGSFAPGSILGDPDGVAACVVFVGHRSDPLPSITREIFLHSFQAFILFAPYALNPLLKPLPEKGVVGVVTTVKFRGNPPLFHANPDPVELA